MSDPVSSSARVLTLLLVHGIGQQKPGSVVDPVGNAILLWLNARLSDDRCATVERAVLKPAERGMDGPAEVTLIVRGRDGKPLGRLRLVESLWASEFDPPGFSAVLRWTLGPASWLLFRWLVNGQVRLARALLGWTGIEGNIWRVATGVAGVVAMAFVLGAQLAGVALALLRLVPVAAIAGFVDRIVGIVSEVIGDSYVFTRNPVMRQAVVDRVRCDLDASGAVAVLAHSQGAAVSLEMLEQHPSPPIFVSYGAGIRKLHELSPPERGGIAEPAIFTALWVLALLGVAAMVKVIFNAQSVQNGNLAPDRWAGISFCLLGVIYFCGFVFGVLFPDAEIAVDKSLAKRIRLFLQRQPAWLDLFASDDAVPAGPLVGSAGTENGSDFFRRGSETPTGVNSRRIVNNRSLLTDHVSYWRNADGFIDVVMPWLAAETGNAWVPSARNLPSWCRRSVRSWLPFIAQVFLAGGALVLFVRAGTSPWHLFSSGDQAGAHLAARLPEWMHAARPFTAAATNASYPLVGLVALAAIHLAGAMIFHHLVLLRIWLRVDASFALDPPVGWKPRLERVGLLTLFLVCFGTASAALVSAIATRSYGPLISVPADWLLRIHEWFFP